MTDNQIQFNVPTVDDPIKEDDEIFTCSLVDSPDPPLVILDTPNAATVTIIDDDG